MDSNNTSQNPHFGRKILKQLSPRGWTEALIIETYKKSYQTKKTLDTRYNLDGTQKNDPATVYYKQDGSYIVCNDITGDVVQISNRNDPDWIGPVTFEL